ncbi:MAG: hypothetical protein ABI639_15595 [Thermoanaerobaculia bacterium]
MTVSDIAQLAEMARLLGSRGGKARGERLSAVEKKRIASLGGKARMSSLRASRRIIENLRYAAAADELRGKGRVVRSENTFTGRLPGIYPGDS